MSKVEEVLPLIRDTLVEVRRFVAAGSSNTCERLTGRIDDALASLGLVDMRWHDEEIERLRRLNSEAADLGNQLAAERNRAERKASDLEEVNEALERAAEQSVQLIDRLPELEPDPATWPEKVKVIRRVLRGGLAIAEEYREEHTSEAPSVG